MVEGTLPFDKKPEAKLRKWFVAHPHAAIYEHKNLIGNLIEKDWLTEGIKRNVLVQASTACFGDICEGDIIAYYDYSQGLLIGLFQVVSKEELDEEERERTQKVGKHEYLLDDDCWKDCMVYYIKPYIQREGKYLDLKKLVQLSKDRSQFSEEISKYISKADNFIIDFKQHQNNMCMLLSEEDYLRIKTALLDTNSTYFRDAPTDLNDDIGVLSSLLEFYNSRTTSFANLFVASIFGIVTLSAIIITIDSSFDANNFWSNTKELISLIPYVAFVFAGYFTFNKYSYYADIAEKIKSYGLEMPSRMELSKILMWQNEGNKPVKQNLANFIKRKAKDQRSFIKHIRSTRLPVFSVSFFCSHISFRSSCLLETV